MDFSFDRVIDRRNTNSLKWDYAHKYIKHDDVLPLWVADMDFASPPRVREALVERASHGVFGYAGIPDSYLDACIDWQKRIHDWSILSDWIIPTPGVIPAINTAIRAFSRPGDRVVIQPPVYFAFFKSVTNNKRKLLLNPLLQRQQRQL